MKSSASASGATLRSPLIPALLIIVAAIILKKTVPVILLLVQPSAQPSIQPSMLQINQGAWQDFILSELHQQQVIGAPTIESLDQALQKQPKAISAAIIDLHTTRRVTGLSRLTLPDLTYTVYKGKLEYGTTAHYGYQKPVCAAKPGAKLDFKIAAAVNFGLRGFVFGDKACDEWQVGEYDTAYFSVAVSQEHRLLAFAVRGKYRIELYSLPDLKKLYDIKGFAASSLAFWKGDLYFSASRKRHKDTASLYRYSLSDQRIKAVYLRNKLVDARGIAFRDDKLGVVSDSKRSRLIAFNPSEQFAITHIWQGMSYPNGVSFDSDGNLLVADEHHNLVRKISMQDFRELWHSPPGQLSSPGSVIEIPKGRYQGHYLIADADGNRLLLVEPKSWDVVFEAGNIPSVMGAAAIFEE